MRFTSSVAFALLGAVNFRADTVGFGPYFALGPTKSWIREATTTLVLPKVPSPQADRLALWPGMETGRGNLNQALAVSFADPAANCGAKAGQWCTWASTLEGEQLGSKQVPANPGDQVTMHYKYNSGTSKYDQTVSINGNTVSTLSTSSGEAQGWGTAVECQDNACKSSGPSHQYINTKITLNSADTTFAGTLATLDSSNSGLKTSDHITFTVSTLSINAHTFDI